MGWRSGVLVLMAAMVWPSAASSQETSGSEVIVNCQERGCLVKAKGDHALFETLARGGAIGGKKLHWDVSQTSRPPAFAGLPAATAENWKVGQINTPQIWLSCPSITTTSSCYMSVWGDLVSGFSDTVFSELLRHANESSLVVKELALSSPGGGIVAGLAIGREVHRSAMTVTVAGSMGARCASACTFIFLAGRTGRHVWGAPTWWLGTPWSKHRDKVQFHNWYYKDAAKISDRQYLDGLADDTVVRTFLRDIDMPEAIWDWAAAIPANTIRPLSPSQWELIGEYPPTLRDLIGFRCGSLFDDTSAAWTATLAASSRDHERMSDAHTELMHMSIGCVDAIIRPVQREAQLGQR